TATVAAHRSADTRIAWKGCGKQLQCARVRVPLDWARPGLGTISLAVVRHLASRPKQRIGSLFVNYGGPGVAGVPLVKAGGAELDRLGHGRFDVVGWDPRGTGACTTAGAARCALAGHGSVKVRVSRLLARLRRGPIPAPSAPAPHRLSYGDLLLYMFGNLGRPASWPQIAAGLEQTASGNGSDIETALAPARPLYRSALNSATALQCADKPRSRLGPQAWPSIIGRVTRVSPFL